MLLCIHLDRQQNPLSSDMWWLTSKSAKVRQKAGGSELRTAVIREQCEEQQLPGHIIPSSVLNFLKIRLFLCCC